MKLSATKVNLQKGLSLVSRAVGNAATLPVLANILLETEKGRLRLSATDLEIGVVTWVGAKVEVDGAITVPARTITDFVGTNTDETIAAVTDKEKLSVSSASFKAEIPGIAATEYPNIPSIDQGSTALVPGDSLLKALKGVIVACALDEARPALAGVAFQSDGQKLNVVATDSFRLAEYDLDLDQEISKLNIIVPARAVHEVVRILSQLDDKNMVTLLATNNQAQFKMGDAELVTRLIEASYPDYKKVIPTSFVTELVISSEELANALRMASIFTTTQANNVQVKIEEDSVRLTSVASPYGQEVSAINAEVMHHTPEKNLDIAFNNRYLLDAVVATGGSKVVVKFSGPTSAAVVVNPDIPEYQHIVMPIRVSD